jgi:Fur family transcriptional regulator, ferric uptake regulator
MPTTPLSDASKIERRCVEHGLRMTDQRRIIAQVLSDAADHPDVEEVHRRANAIDARISLSTVYRTLKLFADRGILERHDFSHGAAHSRGRYELSSDQHHDHLVDMETGRVIEFSNTEIEALQERIARELGFRLVGHRLELYGVPLSKRATPRRDS